jgi:hypothetical protein
MKLETYYRPIIDCRVLVEFAERHHRAGNHYHVRIDLDLPGGSVTVDRQASARLTLRREEALKTTKGSESDAGHRYGRVAVREAFDIARRRLQDYARRQRGIVKTRGVPRRPARRGAEAP